MGTWLLQDNDVVQQCQLWQEHYENIFTDILMHNQNYCYLIKSALGIRTKDKLVKQENREKSMCFFHKETREKMPQSIIADPAKVKRDILWCYQHLYFVVNKKQSLRKNVVNSACVMLKYIFLYTLIFCHM